MLTEFNSDVFPTLSQHFLIGKLTHRLGNGQRNLKTALSGIYNVIQELKDQMDRMEGQLQVMTTTKKAATMVSEDSKTLGLRWNSLLDMELGLDTLEKEEACARLLLSPRLWDQSSRFIASIHGVFFTDSFVGCMFWATPDG